MKTVIIGLLFFLSLRTFADNIATMDTNSIEYGYNKLHTKISKNVAAIASKTKQVLSIENIDLEGSTFEYLYFDKNFDIIAIKSDFLFSSPTHCIVNNFQVEGIIDTSFRKEYSIISIIGDDTFAKKSEKRTISKKEAEQINASCTPGEIHLVTYFHLDYNKCSQKREKYNRLIKKVLFDFSTFSDSVQGDSVSVTYRFPNDESRYDKYKCSKTLFNGIVQVKNRLNAKKEVRTSLRPKAAAFAQSLKKGENLSSYFANNWTFVYESYDRCDGSKNGQKKSLSPKDIDNSISLIIKPTGGGWEDCGEPIELKDFTMSFNLKAYAKNWERNDLFEDSEDYVLNSPTREFGFWVSGESGSIVISFNEMGKIAMLKYSSVDPG